MAEAIGLKAGWALDLSVNQDNGEPWDLSIPKNQVAALKMQEEEAPHLLIASPMCAAFSSLQHFNYRDMTPKELEEKLRAAIEHLDFAMKMCNSSKVRTPVRLRAPSTGKVVEPVTGQKTFQIQGCHHSGLRLLSTGYALGRVPRKETNKAND